MMRAIFLLVLMIGALCIDQTLSILPGFKIRLTKKGLEYANNVAHTALAKELKTLTIPNQSGHDGHMDWSLTGIQNRGCSIPSSSMTFAPTQNGLTWAMSNLGISLRADWRVKYKKGWFKVSTSGSADVDVKSVSAQVTIHLAEQSAGRPSVSTASCSASIGGVDVHFHGGTAFILNRFRHVIGDKIKGLMQDQICKLVTKEINTDANQKLSQIKVGVEIDHRFVLNYSLIASPTVQSINLETQHKGETFWKGESKEAPLAPKPIPALADESRMLYLWVTDYIANSFAYTAQLHKFLQYNITAKDFDADKRSYLNTTCTLMCIGKLIPQIGKKYPNALVDARVVSLQAPSLTINPKTMSVMAVVNADLYAVTGDTQSHYLMTLTVKGSASVKGSVVKERLTGEIVDHSVTVNVVKSAVGTVNDKVLNLVLSGALNFAVIPKLNAILEKGMDLPVTGALSFQNTQLTLLNGSLVIATDLAYNQST